MYVKWLWYMSANDGGNSTVDDTHHTSVESTSMEDSNSGDERPRLFNLFRRRRRRTRDTNNNNNNKNNICLLPSPSIDDKSCNRSGCDYIMPIHSMNNECERLLPSNNACIQIDNEFERLLPNACIIDEHITTLWKRRRRWSIPSLLRNREVKQKSIKCRAILGNTTTNTDRIKAGGGCIIEGDTCMQLMDVMLTEEKEREDLLYDLWIRDMNDLDMSDEPEFGWDNRGWYKSIESNYESEVEDDASDDEATNLMNNK